MLSAKQVRDVYIRLHTEDKADLPYVYSFKDGNKSVTFFGSVHSNDPMHPQVILLQNEWKKFVNIPGKKLVIQERIMTSNDLADTLEESIRTHEESGLVLWLAKEAGIEAVSGEQSRDDEVQALKNRGYSDASIMTYYFARQFVQWARSDRVSAPDWKKYAEEVVAGYNKSVKCWDKPLTLKRMLDWFKAETGKPFNAEKTESLSVLSDPYTSEVSQVSGDVRDEYLLSLIKDRWHGGISLFIVYGSGHAIKLENDIKKIVKLGKLS